MMVRLRLPGGMLLLLTLVACASTATIAPESHHTAASTAADTPRDTPAQSQQKKTDTRTKADDERKDDDVPREKVRIGRRIFELEIAADSKARARGLMDREELEEDDGMIFVYPTGIRTLSFWMKNCLIDIDVVFLNSRGRVVAMHAMKAEEPRGKDESLLEYEDRLKLYSSKRPAQYAVELQAGMIEELEVEVGDEIIFDRAKLAKLARENDKKEREQADDGPWPQ